MATVIHTQGLVKRYGKVHALDGLDLDVEAGQVHGFLGPNGAGKSTTIRILLGLARATSGEATVFGADPWRDAVALHRRIASVPGDVSLWPNLSGGEAIDLLARLRGAPRARRRLPRPRRSGSCEAFQFDPRKKGRALLEGQPAEGRAHRRLRVPADLYILDEPTSGLDPLMEVVFRAEIDAHPGGRRDRAAVEPHPLRGRAALRPGQHHPRRAGSSRPARSPSCGTSPAPRCRSTRGRRGARRHPGRARRDASPRAARGSRSTATRVVGSAARARAARRAGTPHRAAVARGAVPAPLRRRPDAAARGSAEAK